MEEIYKILFVNNKLQKQALNKLWYQQKNILDIYHKIFSDTFFLDKFNPTLRERIFYIQNNLKEIQLCTFCNKNKLNFFNNTIKLSKCCNNKECKSKLKSKNTKLMFNNFTLEQYQTRSKKISEKNKGKIFSKEHIEKIKQTRLKNNFKQSLETKQKRIETRKNNGKPWHTKETLLKISHSNKITHSSKEFQEKNKESRQKGSAKISKTMKQKIADGLFTPPITNTWTKWRAYINLNNNIIKFRSNWEALFFLHNTKLKFEKTRIKYFINNDEKIYITDFTDDINKIIYEIKPLSTQNNELNKIKTQAALDWCNKNNYKYIIIDENWFKNNHQKINLEQNLHLQCVLQKIIS